jgi:hypothetical protein
MMHVATRRRRPPSRVMSATSLSAMMPDLPEGFAMMCGLALLAVLLAAICFRLEAVRSLLLPETVRATTLSEVPGMMMRKVRIVLYGAVFLVLSKDKLSKKELRQAADASSAAAAAAVGPTSSLPMKKVRIIFIRHGESVWNYVFNRGFGPSFLVRLVAVTLRELYLLPWDDSAYIDSPLSALGREQCSELRRFLRQPCHDPNVQRDFDVLTKGESESLLVSSQLRRAAATAFIALSDRIARSKEKVVLHSSCQEISRNFDTMALAAPGAAPRFGSELGTAVDPAACIEASANAGNKSLSFPGYARIHDFAQWASERPERTIIVAGHSLWFRSFFQCLLPPSSDHIAKKRKIVNAGVVAFDLATNARGFSIDPSSIVVVYGGFASK